MLCCSIPVRFQGGSLRYPMMPIPGGIICITTERIVRQQAISKTGQVRGQGYRKSRFIARHVATGVAYDYSERAIVIILNIGQQKIA